MNIKSSVWNITLAKLLVVLLVLNYTVITILLNDFFLLKYLRDVILIVLFLETVGPSLRQGKIKLYKIDLLAILMIVWLIVAFFLSDNKVLASVSFRRYLFPLILFFVASHMNNVSYDTIKQTHFFLLRFFATISIWGVFQAHVLGDSFLKNIGYASAYSNGYGRVMLANSFYFGGLGVQRVVATFSNSNICGLILGAVLLYLVCNIKLYQFKKKHWVMFLLICLGYILTFSRSNFLAMLIVLIIGIYPYIPYKKIIVSCIALGIIVFLFGLVCDWHVKNKFFAWVVNSLTLTESSASGRSSIWSLALQCVLENPLGIGFGYVGSIARDANVSASYSCENSYLAIGIDSGWIGMSLYFSWFFCIALKIKRGLKRYKDDIKIKAQLTSAFALLLYLAIVSFFSNHIYDMEAISIVYLFVGWTVNLLSQKTNDLFPK